ncbi:hypothetical protein JH06_1667, partial [Blastocystis sp. subtype 4]|uniref:hypothetical protein n=1 Tax=Blastocystis sp. subtype 4 TaxID=944170 RepID=UPI00071222D3
KWIDDCELIVTSCVESLIIDDHFNPDISSLILNNSLISLKRIDIGKKCFENVSRFVIDGLNELETIIIGKKSFRLDDIGEGSKCLIMNCDQLKQINIRDWSFNYYESLECKNLPSLISIQLDDYVFYWYHSIVFENLPSLSSFNGDDCNIPSLTRKGIQMNEYAFGEVDELDSSNADSLDQFIRQNSNLCVINYRILMN